MTRDAQIEARLVAWAQWLRVGDGSGFSRLNVLHEEWSPPTPGQTPTMASAMPSTTRHTARLVARLSERQQATLGVVYCFPGLPVVVQCERLGCAEPTIEARVQSAHRRLRAMLDEEKFAAASSTP